MCYTYACTAYSLILQSIFCMVKNVCLLVLVMGCCVPVLAQQHAKMLTPPLPDTGYKHLLSGELVRHIIVDSLNKRYAPVDGVVTTVKTFIPGGLNDTAHHALYKYISATDGVSRLHVLQQRAAILKDSTKLNAYLDGKLRGFYALQNPLPVLPDMRRMGFGNKFQGASGSAFFDNGAAAVIQSGYKAQLSDQAVLGNIPFTINYTNISGQSSFQPGFSDQSLTKISFDKDAYRQRLSGYVNSHYDLKKYFLQDINAGAALRSYTSFDLQSIEKQMDSVYVAKGKAGFKSVISADQLLYLDSVQLRNAVMGQPGADSLQAGLSGDYLQQLYTLKKQYGAIAPKEILNAQHDVNGKVGAWMQGDQQQAQTDKALLPLNFVQKLFLKAQSLNIGNFAASGSKGLSSGLFMKGIQGTFLGNNDKTMMLGAGLRQDAGGLKDAPFTASLEGSGYVMEMLQTGKGMPDAAQHSLVGAVNANTKATTMNQFSTIALPRNIFVGTYSRSMQVGAYGTLDAELGKSANSFNNATVGSDYASAGKAAALTLMSDFWQTFSAGLDFNGHVDEWKLTHREYVSYSGMAYNNPASPFAGRGTIRYGLNLKRSWNKNKLVIGVKMDQRTIHNDPDGNNVWRNQQYGIDARYKVKRNFSFTASISQAAMRNTASSDHSNDFLTRQFSMSSQVSGTLWNVLQSSNVTTGLQQMNVGNLKSLLVNVNLNHNVVLHSNVISLNVFYNKDVKDNALYGNMFNTEVMYNYTLWKQLSCGSGITYLSDVPVVTQVGIKQTLTAVLAKKLTATLYMDCRKSLHNTPQNYLYGTFRSEVALHYAF